MYAADEGRLGAGCGEGEVEEETAITRTKETVQDQLDFEICREDV